MNYIGITSNNWFNFLKDKKSEEPVNFWRKNTSGINIIKEGDLFFFLVKHEDRKVKFQERPIGGYGVFKKFETLTPEQAWEKYQKNNGSPNFEKFLEATNHIFHEELSKIGCIILENVVFFKNPIFLSELNINFSSAVVSGKSITEEETKEILASAGITYIKNLQNKEAKIGLRSRYFEKFKDYCKFEFSKFKITADNKNYIDHKFGEAYHICIYVYFNEKKPYAKVTLYIPDNHRLFRKFEQKKLKIEEALKTPLMWNDKNSNSDAVARKISKILDEDIGNEENWDESFKNIVETAEKMKEVFSNCLKDSSFAVDEEEFNDTIEISEIVAEEIGPKKRGQAKQINSTERWSRDAGVSKTALNKSGYRCEFDSTHESFISKNTGEIYLEAHHLIPMNAQQDFEYSLDVVGNVISLCPNCHKKIHHSTPDEVEIMLEKFYDERKNILEKYGIGISLEELKKLYNGI